MARLLPPWNYQNAALGRRVYAFASERERERDCTKKYGEHCVEDTCTDRRDRFTWEGKISRGDKRGKAHGRTCAEAKEEFCAIYGRDGACEGDVPREFDFDFGEDIDIRNRYELQQNIIGGAPPMEGMGPEGEEGEYPPGEEPPAEPPAGAQGMFDSVCGTSKIPILCNSPQTFMLVIAFGVIVSFMFMILMMKK